MVCDGGHLRKARIFVGAFYENCQPFRPLCVPHCGWFRRLGSLEYLGSDATLSGRATILVRFLLTQIKLT